MVIAWKYYLEEKREGKEKIYCVVSSEQYTCDHCGGNLEYREGRRKKRLCRDGERVIMYRVLKCRSCHRMHTEVPSFLISGRKYSRAAIEWAVTDPLASIPVEEGTLVRWKSELGRESIDGYWEEAERMAFALAEP